MGLNFPSSPLVGDLYPTPALPGIPQYRWDGTVWTTGMFDPLGFVAKTGDTMTGALVLPGNAAAALQAVPKQQLDAAASAATAAAAKNYIINGAMMVSQQNGTTAGTADGYYPADQWGVNFANDGVVSVQQVASLSPAGSPNRIRLTVTTADAAIAANQYYMLRQTLEGLRVADLAFGSAAAKTVTLKFGVKAPAGTYCVSLRNNVPDRTYLAPFTISGGEANTDVYKTLTIPGDVAGTWLKNNLVGMYVTWGLAVGTDYQAAGNVWQAGGTFGTSAQSNFLATNGNVFELFDVGLYAGTVAPDFVVPDPARTLRECQRYYLKIDGGIFCQGQCTTTSAAYGCIVFPEVMRANPTLTASGSFNVWNGAGDNVSAANPSLTVGATDRALIGWTSAGGLVVGNATTYLNAGAARINFNARL